MSEPTPQDQKAILAEQLRLLTNTIWTKTTLAKAFTESGMDGTSMATEAANLMKVRDVLQKQLESLP